LERALQSWLPSRRWFGGNARAIRNVRVQEMISIANPASPKNTKMFLTFVLVEYVQTEPEIYILPLASSSLEAVELLAPDSAPFVIARLKFSQSDQTGVLYDAIASKDFGRALLDLLSTQNSLIGKSGQLEAMHTAELGKIVAENNGPVEPSAARADQGHSSIIFGEKLILKFFRRLNYGSNPDLEILKFLMAQKFPHVPQLAGALEYRSGKGEASTVAILTSFVPKAKDAWEYSLDSLGKFYERVETLPPAERVSQLPVADVTRLATAELDEPAKNLLGIYMESARLMGERTAAMHLALATDTENSSFAPEPFTQHAQRGVFESMRSLMQQNFQLLNRRLKTLPPEIQAQAQKVLALEPEVLKKFRQIYQRQLNATRIREHGDYHLGQLLYTGKDFLITDFEGDPAVAISERRLKRSPLQDVASMVRSFHQVAHAALLAHLERGTPVDGQLQPMLLWSRFWARWVSAIFFKAYLQTAGKAAFLPPAQSDLQMMTEVFLLRKMVCELGWELANRPDWVKIPLQGILEMMNEQNATPPVLKEDISKSSN
jgi:maltose alpha-D-glucosyltransferase/alpha-amylase